MSTATVTEKKNPVYNDWIMAVDGVETLLADYFPGIRLNPDALLAYLELPNDEESLLSIRDKEGKNTKEKAEAFVRGMLPKVYQEGGGTKISFYLDLMPCEKGTKLDQRQTEAISKRLASSSAIFTVPTFLYPAGGVMYVEFDPTNLAHAATAILETPDAFALDLRNG